MRVTFQRETIKERPAWEHDVHILDQLSTGTAMKDIVNVNTLKGSHQVCPRHLLVDKNGTAIHVSYIASL